MKYTVENPKLVYNYQYHQEKSNFTGVIKDTFGNIAYYENGKWHRENGPAVECPDGRKYWHYHDKHYGWDDDFTTESWIKKWQLEIFK